MKQKQLPRSSTHSIASTLAFRSLLSLLGCSLLMGGLLHFKIHTIPTSSSILKPASSSQESHLLPPPHLVPKLPYLPPFPTIENDEELIYQTLHRNQPTIAGIAAILYRFLQALHSSNVRFSKLLGHATAEDIRAEYFRLAYQHLVPLDRAYDGRPIFSIRRDDSIYVSVAAFREYLLAETLMSAFEHAAHPERLFVGVIVQNCFLGEKCQKGTKVVGKDRNGKDVLEVIDGIPDPNHIESFCTNSTTFRKYCDNGQVRVLYVNETDALGPAAARYYSSKLWGGETYYVQIDSHLQFAHGWDELYIQDLKLTKNFPKSILSTYPPGFVNFRQYPPFTPGTRLCKCQIRATEGWLVRVEMNGRCHENETRPTQMSFMGAGFFFAPAEFLVDVPYDPFLPYLFMGEEVALSIRAWTSGYNIYAPRKNLIGHQYRPVRSLLLRATGHLVIAFLFVSHISSLLAHT